MRIRVTVNRWSAMFLIVCVGCVARSRNEHDLDDIASLQVGRIVSGSMEPTLAGPKRSGFCSDCDRSFRFSISGIAVGKTVRCPNCGSPLELKNQIEPGMVVRFRTDFSDDELTAGALVVIDRNETSEVKRIVAQPHQKLTVREGDIWLQDAIYQKRWDEFLRQAILVHCESMADARAANRRWNPIQDDWYVYHHASLWPIRSGSFGSHATAIHDDFFLNPGEAKSLVPVRDLGCLVQFNESAVSVKSEFVMRIGERLLHVEIQQGEETTIIRWNGSDSAIHLPHTFRHPTQFHAMAVFDDSVWVGFSESAIRLTSSWSQSSTTSNGPNRFQLTAECPMAIRLQKGTAKQLWVIRDNYWRGVGNVDQQSFDAQEGYLAFGDNNAISEDSRSIGRIPRAAIRAIVEPPEGRLDSLWEQVRSYSETVVEPAVEKLKD